MHDKADLKTLLLSKLNAENTLDINLRFSSKAKLITISWKFRLIFSRKLC